MITYKITYKTMQILLSIGIYNMAHLYSGVLAPIRMDKTYGRVWGEEREGRNVVITIQSQK